MRIRVNCKELEQIKRKVGMERKLPRVCLSFAKVLCGWQIQDEKRQLNVDRCHF